MHTINNLSWSLWGILIFSKVFLRMWSTTKTPWKLIELNSIINSVSFYHSATQSSRLYAIKVKLVLCNNSHYIFKIKANLLFYSWTVIFIKGNSCALHFRIFSSFFLLNEHDFFHCEKILFILKAHVTQTALCTSPFVL